MLALMKRLFVEEAAQDLAEYGIALAVIATVTAAVVVAVGTSVADLWTAAQTVIAAA
jgi:Flp pilus assembly pilin Flp